MAEFGTVSKSKVTQNPAGAAVIDRILFDFTAFDYEAGNRYSLLGGQIRDYGRPGDAYFGASSNSFYRISSVSYESGRVTGMHVDLAYPTAFFTFGVGLDNRWENYEKGRFVTDYDINTSVNMDGSAVSDVEASYNRRTTSYFLAVPLPGFSFGFRQNRREVNYKVENLDGIYLEQREPIGIYGSSWADPIYSGVGISGTSSYQYGEYGLMANILGFNPRLDAGYLYRPPVEAVMEFDPSVLGQDIYNGSSGYYTLQKMPFTEPGLKLTTINLEFGGGSIALQGITEWGDFTEVENSLPSKIRPGISKRNRAYDVMGFLVRFAYSGIFEIAYGSRSQEIAGSLTELITYVLKLPIPLIGKKLLLTIGRQDIRVKDDNDVLVAESASWSFSTEMKFGKPVKGPGRKRTTVTGRSLPPKTKELPYYMEF
ncbi:MAG: hypothetical protein GY866_23280 [Proteobacteria bacterium]|nr:hypothetical protein [Pseudomonadota bacterium]